MLLQIPELLNPAQLEKIHELLARARFVDGKLTAGMAARRVKENEELAPDPELLQRLYRIVMASVGHSATFRSAALPSRVADFIFARYQPGMHYGDHVDDPIMGQGTKFRTDVSMTIFLNPPEEYDGGELVIRTPFGEQRVKLPAGHAVVYPSASVHRVAEEMIRAVDALLADGAAPAVAERFAVLCPRNITRQPAVTRMAWTTGGLSPQVSTTIWKVNGALARPVSSVTTSRYSDSGVGMTTLVTYCRRMSSGVSSRPGRMMVLESARSTVRAASSIRVRLVRLRYTGSAALLSGGHVEQGLRTLDQVLAEVGQRRAPAQGLHIPVGPAADRGGPAQGGGHPRPGGGAHQFSVPDLRGGGAVDSDGAGRGRGRSGVSRAA